jgi:acetoin utilization deacetylase AcuC-like enzyme
MLRVVHHPGYTFADSSEAGPRFDKYGLVMELLRACGAAFEEHVPEPIDRRWIEAVHDPAYVEQVLTQTVPRDKERRIGFPVTEWVARRSCLSSGGTWLAARLALEHGFAANSAGGSHHAGHDSGAGYCVFNDLAIVANRLIAEGDADRVLIVDLDVHQGDGTAALTAGRADIFTLSLHAERNYPVRKMASSLDVPLADAIGDDAYLDHLASVLPGVIDGFAPDLILYQAGVDVHADDKLGRLALSDAGIAARDRFVMRSARDRGVPVASTLGGGYGEDLRLVAARHVASLLTLADEAAKPAIER